MLIAGSLPDLRLGVKRKADLLSAPSDERSQLYSLVSPRRLERRATDEDLIREVRGESFVSADLTLRLSHPAARPRPASQSHPPRPAVSPLSSLAASHSASTLCPLSRSRMTTRAVPLSSPAAKSSRLVRSASLVASSRASPSTSTACLAAWRRVTALSLPAALLPLVAPPPRAPLGP